MSRHMGLLLCVFVAGTCSAQKISITVADMPLPEVVQLLRDMTGAQFIGEAAANALPNTPHITLDLQDAALKAVVKEMCRQAGWHFVRFGQGYHLMPGAAKEEGTRPHCEVGIYDVSLQGLNVSRTLSLSFSNPEPKASLDHRTTLQLVCETDDDEMLAAVWAFDPNVIVVTDTGVTLEPLQREAWGQGSLHEALVRGYVALQPPPPDAKRIARIEGDLIMYATVLRADFDLTPEDVGVTKEAEGLSLTLTAFDARTGQTECELTVPKETEEAARMTRGMVNQPTVTLTLLDAEGQLASSTGSGSSGGTEGNVRRYKQHYSFSLKEGFVPAKIHYHVLVPSDPGDRLTYLIEDVPLPRDEDVVPALGALP